MLTFYVYPWHSTYNDGCNVNATTYNDSCNVNATTYNDGCNVNKCHYIVNSFPPFACFWMQCNWFEPE